MFIPIIVNIVMVSIDVLVAMMPYTILVIISFIIIAGIVYINLIPFHCKHYLFTSTSRIICQIQIKCFGSVINYPTAKIMFMMFFIV